MSANTKGVAYLIGDLSEHSQKHRRRQSVLTHTAGRVSVEAKWEFFWPADPPKPFPSPLPPLEGPRDLPTVSAMVRQRSRSPLLPVWSRGLPHRKCTCQKPIELLGIPETIGPSHLMIPTVRTMASSRMTRNHVEAPATNTTFPVSTRLLEDHSYLVRVANGDDLIRSSHSLWLLPVFYPVLPTSSATRPSWSSKARGWEPLPITMATTSTG